jgi:hypothetical protein
MSGVDTEEDEEEEDTDPWVDAKVFGVSAVVLEDGVIALGVACSPWGTSASAQIISIEVSILKICSSSQMKFGNNEIRRDRRGRWSGPVNLSRGR